MQYRALGTKGVGEPGGAGCRDEKTHSGESNFEMCSRKVAFHGAGFGESELEVVAMVRSCRVRPTNESRREIDLEAMMTTLESSGKDRWETDDNFQTAQTCDHSPTRSPRGLRACYKLWEWTNN